MHKLLKLAKTLRDPKKGCPWDQKQTFLSFKKCLIEEVEEVIQAIDSENYENLKEELGDALFNLIFIINLAEEKQLFSMDDVVNDVYEKMVERHPHVFGQESASTPEEAKRFFYEAKRKQKNKRN
ncbi:MazG nucleotide pyrophosphohydrolase domain-containing protein [Candidatus Uabimicrobium amorphum]|uniref:MazG nucleotide pyrophosphohydrolase domain-containing protein n=1 Tax=Uabimicrobium amorphum TaxID=2596890 RepID=UPI00125EE6BD|nr:MazG nucleotide pyrophosphohydrolase domain-containing protein [Candidatus Uabimicrobium amorphum]